MILEKPIIQQIVNSNYEKSDPDEQVFTALKRLFVSVTSL